MIEGLLGRKLGMVQAFDNDGHMRAATVIETGPCLVTQIKTEDRDGYNAVQLGFGPAKRVNKAMRGHLKQQGNLRYLREFRVDDPTQHKLGERIGAEIFEPGDEIDVTGVSKGRGFAGGVKRHGFAGGPKTHGQSDRHRAPGAIGAGNTPGRTFKGMRMAGHMGDENITVRGLEVLQSDPARGLLLVAGSVPGARHGLLKIRYNSRTLQVARTRTPKPADAAPPSETAPQDEDEEAAAEQPAAEAAVEETTEAVAEVAPESSAEAPEAEAPADDEAAAEAEASDEAPAEEAPEAEAEAAEEAPAEADEAEEEQS